MTEPLIVETTTQEGKHYSWMFWCPGCEKVHQFDDRWTFNGDVHKPTFKPSLLVRYPVYGAQKRKKEVRCHSFVTDGQIRFLGDCTHKLKGTTVNLEPFRWENEDA